MFTVTDYGACGDGATLNTSAVQAAIDECGASGGGTVVVPPGIFVTGTLWLRDGVELHLAKGAVLKGSTDLGDYNKLDAYPQNFESSREEWKGAHLILGVEVSDVAVTGPGIIDGSGDVFYGNNPLSWSSCVWRFGGMLKAKNKDEGRPGQTIVFCESKNIRIRDLTIRNTSCWSCFLHGCDDVFVSSLKINNAYDAGNTDGIDIDCCRNVTLSDCIVDTGDDAITLRGSPGKLRNKSRVCENVVISNCVLGSSACAIRIGVGDGVIRNAVISNLAINRGGTGVKFQSAYSRGPGVSIANITVKDVYARDLAIPFMIVSGDTAEATAQIENITIDGFHAEVFSGGEVAGNAKTRPRNIRLRNIDLTVVPHPGKLLPGEKHPASLLNFRCVDNVLLDNVRVAWKSAGPEWKRVVNTDDVTDVIVMDNCSLPDPENG